MEDSAEERGGLTVEERRGRPGESVELRELLLVFLPILAHELCKYWAQAAPVPVRASLWYGVLLIFSRELNSAVATRAASVVGIP